VTFPPGVDWFVLRPVVSGKFHASRDDVTDRWDLAQLYEAHAVLDALEE